MANGPRERPDRPGAVAGPKRPATSPPPETREVGPGETGVSGEDGGDDFVVPGQASPAETRAGGSESGNDFGTLSAIGETLIAGSADDSLGFVLNSDILSPPQTGPEAAPFAGTVRFAIGEEIGAGGMGIVYRAFDRDRDEAVALKTMRRVNPAALYRFKNEFRALADLSHPNLVNYYELIADGGLWFFTMELVPGVDFVTEVRGRVGVDRLEPGVAPPPERLASLRAALKQLAGGLTALHDAGKLHCDVKPTNVLVTPGGRVVLLDFGLAADLDGSGRHRPVDSTVVGTVGYMAPEQAAGEALSAAGDWYSVGVMLFETLTGTLPFDGPHNEVLAAKRRHDPGPPSGRVPGLPDDLDRLCVDLLKRSPHARPGSPEILARLDDAAGGADPAPPAGHAVATGEVATIPPEPSTDPESAARPTAARLVGRERHLAVLDAALTEVRAGRPVRLMVSGRSGSGKSTLLQAFLGGLQGGGEAVVLSGRCYERESLPYKALDSVVDALSRHLKSLPPADAVKVLPTDLGELARMFPVLRRVEAVAQATRGETQTPDRQEARRRAVAALRALLARIGRSRPLVVAVDDLQWGGQENAALLDDLQRPPDAPVLLFLGSYREEDAATSPLLRELLDCRPTPQAAAAGVGSGAGSSDGPLSRVLVTSAGPAEGPDRRELTVGPLTQAEARDFALELLGRADATARATAHTLAKASQGNPFLLDELVKHVAGGGGLPDGRVEVGDVLYNRVAGLPADARRLLEVVAVAGRPVGLTEACKAAGLDPSARGAAASALRAGRLVRATGRPSRDEVEPYHDWVRQAVAPRLPAGASATYHLRLAEALEAAGGAGADPESLALHYREAGRPERASECYALAGDRSVEALAFRHAANLYRLALELRPADAAGGQDGDEAEGARLRARLGEALANAGRARESAAAYLEAAGSPALSAAEVMDLKRRAAAQLLIAGQVEGGTAVLHEVLRAQGMSAPAGPRAVAWSLAGRRAWLRLRGLGYRERPADVLKPEALSRIDLCWSAGAALSLIDPVRGAELLSRGLALALRAGEPHRVARALAMESARTALAGSPAECRAAALLDRVRGLAGRLGDPHLDGLVELIAAVNDVMVGRWAAAAGAFGRAESTFRGRCTGVIWELDTLHNLSLWALTQLGALAELKRRWPALVRESRDRGDRDAVTNLNTYAMAVTRLADGEPAQALADLDRARLRRSGHGYRASDATALRARVAIELYQGKAAAALRRARDDQPSYRRSHLRGVQLLRVQHEETLARCLLAASDLEAEPEALVLEAEALAIGLGREGVAWAEAHSVLLRAGVAARRGESPAAVALLKDAAARYEAADMRVHAAAATRALGRYFGPTLGRGEVERADAVLAAEGVRDPTAFAAVFAPGFEDHTGRAQTLDALAVLR